jgi:hypothetical protein
MREKKGGKLLFFVLVSSFLVLEPLFCLQEPEYKGFIDFDITLKELDTNIKTNQVHRISKDKILFLNGIFAEVSPRTSRQNLYVALIKEQDLQKPQAFIQKIQTANNPLTQWLKEGLSEETKGLLADYQGQITPPKELIKALLKDLSNLMSKKGLIEERYLAGFALSKELRALLKLKPASLEEQSYLNRLIMEEVFNEELAAFQVKMDLVRGEWQGLEEVKSYRASLLFSGVESFKVFHRMRITEASSLMIPLNSAVLVAARPYKIEQDEAGNMSYLLKGIYIRVLN